MSIYVDIIGPLDLTQGPGMKRMAKIADTVPQLKPFMDDLRKLALLLMQELRAAVRLGLSSPVKEVEPAAEATDRGAYTQRVKKMSAGRVTVNQSTMVGDPVRSK